MNSRASVLMFGLSLIACQMDNPAFEDGVDEVGDEGTGSTGESGESGSSSGESTSEGTDVDTTSDMTSDSTDNSGTTDADCPPGSKCGTCHVCDPDGACVPDVGATCSEAVLHCGDYLYGAEEGICYRLADTPLSGSCSNQGECKPPSPMLCPVAQGEVHFACDPACVTNPEGCQPYAPAANVDMSTMCAIQGDGPDCKSICSNESGSAIKHYTCSFGECTYVGEDPCNPYACSEDSVQCFMGCELDAECAQDFICMDSDCVLP